MRSLLNNFYRPVLLFLLLLGTSCSQKDVIPQDTMAKIIGEMYLADQFVEQHPQYRAQADSLALYEAITQKYGYSFDNYATSVQYYLQKGDALKKIHIRAKDMLLDQRAEVNRLLTGQAESTLRWWAADSVRIYDIRLLQTEPFLRSVKWLSFGDTPIQWKFTDTTQCDIPQNSLWWNNNITFTVSVPADTLPVLIRDYVIRQKTDAPHTLPDKAKTRSRYDLRLPDGTSIETPLHKMKK